MRSFGGGSVLDLLRSTCWCTGVEQYEQDAAQMCKHFVTILFPPFRLIPTDAARHATNLESPRPY